MHLFFPQRLTGLETDEWSESHACIVVRAAVEVDLVSGFEAKAERAEVRFDAHTRVNRATNVVCAEVVHGVCKRPERSGPWIHLEINKASLDGQKRPNPPMTAYDFWAKQPVKYLEAAVSHRDRAAGAHAVVGESLVKIVAHLSFHHHVREYFDGCASPKSRQIRVRLC